MRVLSSTSLEVLEVSGDDAGEYVCVVDVKGETVSKTHRIIIAGEENIDITTNNHAFLFLQLLP